MRRPGSSASPHRLAEAIRASGNLGLTEAQLARAVGSAPIEISGALRELARRREVIRVGRGLWIDPTLHHDAASAKGFVRPEWYLEKFRSEGRIRVEAYEGDVQFRPNTQEPVHRWWPYVQGFSAGLVRAIGARYGIGPGSVVLDPYAGSGTVPVAARMLGSRSIGVELMPISAAVARAKQAWDVDPGSLRRASDRLLRDARNARPAPKPFLRETDRQFAPGPLLALRRIRAALDSDPSRGETLELLRLAFARILVDSSRLRRSPCLGYGPKATVPPAAPYGLFREAVDRMAVDLGGLQSAPGRLGPPGEILETDSRSFSLPEASVDLSVTSPPYANGMDYVMNYKLELAWLGFARSYGDLRALKERMVACDNLSRSALADRKEAEEVRGEPWIAAVLRDLRTQLAAKGSYRRPDMDRVLAGYFSDLVPTLRTVFRSLRAGGRFVVVNGDSLMAGVYVPSDLIYARLARRVGFEVERFEIARSRRSGQRRDFRLRESILTLRKPVQA